MLEYTRPVEEIKSGFKPWLQANDRYERCRREMGNFEETITNLEAECECLLPEFTKADVMKYLLQRRSISITVIRRFYQWGKLWLKYCIENGYYNQSLSIEDIGKTFLYTTPITSYNEWLSKQYRFIMSEKELQDLLERFIDTTNNYLIACCIVLGWCGIKNTHMVKIKMTDCDKCGKSVTYYDNDGIPCRVIIDNPVFQNIIVNTIRQTDITITSGDKWKLKGDVYLLRSTKEMKANSPISVEYISYSYIHYFNDVLETDYSMNDILMSGKLYRMYEAEQRGDTIYVTSNGNRTNSDLLKTYKIYKQRKEDKGE